MIQICLTSLEFVSVFQKSVFIFIDLLSKIRIWMMQNFTFSKISEISGFETFISDGLISSRKCLILTDDPALDSSDSELFNARFDVITTLFPADLSRFIREYPLPMGGVLGLRNSASSP